MANGPNRHAVDRPDADMTRTQVHAERREVWKLDQARLLPRCCPRPDRARRRKSRGVPTRDRLFETAGRKGKTDPLSPAPAAEGRAELWKGDPGIKMDPINVIFAMICWH